jgi:hypothetical protein
LTNSDDNGRQAWFSTPPRYPDPDTFGYALRHPERRNIAELSRSPLRQPDTIGCATPKSHLVYFQQVTTGRSGGLDSAFASTVFIGDCDRWLEGTVLSWDDQRIIAEAELRMKDWVGMEIAISFRMGGAQGSDT